MDVSIAYQNAIIDNEGAIIELLQQQLISGISGTGEPITLYGETEYSPFTVRYKKQFGSGIGGLTDRITLYMFGEFYAQMFMTVKGEVFSIKSKVPYYDKIIQRSGPEVMMLSPESMDILLELFINPEIKKVLNQHLTP